MKIDRLISIIMILNNKERVTAKELSKKFDVSIKTIQRDIETIEMAGIPIVSYKGHEGGYEIIEGYRVNKASMTKNEVALLKNLLDGINETYRNKDVLSLINKLEIIDSNSSESNRFIIDFSRWGNSSELTDKINIIDNAISQNRCIEFEYNNSNGESSNRKIEPYKIIFKALNWYVYGYCTLKNDMRVFKLTRVKNLEILEEKFEFKDIDIGNLFKDPELETIDVILRVAKEIKIILEDSLPSYEIIEEGNSFVTIKTSLPYNNWVDGMILGFGDKIEVLEPKFLREKLIGKIKGMYEMYR